MKKALLVLVALTILGYGWYRFALRAVEGDSQKRISVTIEQGMSSSSIAELLNEKGLIRSDAAFQLYARLHGAQGKLQAGKFILSPALNVPELIQALQNGKASEVSITIPEGFTVKDIDALLAELGLAEEGEVIACAQTCDFSSFEFLPSAEGLKPRGGKLEGYLYPDTYFVNPNDFVVKFFLERMLGAFRQKILDVYTDEIDTSERSLHELVTMSSLIEEETRTAEERPVVSGIMWKRFDAGSGLGIDATVRYMLNKPTEPLTVADLNTNDPYNTRKFRGLPPGPIANAGANSFEAALRPEESEYWYYLHGTDGKIHYAVTNEDHNMNKYLYIRGGSLQ